MMKQGRRLGSILREVMRTDLQRMEWVSGEESDGHQLVDWTPGQVEGLGTRFACPWGIREEGGERGMSSLKGEWLHSPDAGDHLVAPSTLLSCFLPIPPPKHSGSPQTGSQSRLRVHKM